MKVLCDITYTPNPLSTHKQNRYNRHIYNLGAIAQQLGHEIVIFNGQMSINQLLEQWDAELYIGKASSTPNSIYSHNLKSVILLDHDERYLTNNPDVVVTLDDEYTYSAEHISQLPAVNSTVHVNGKVLPEWKSDVVYVGNRILEKEEAFKKILYPLFQDRSVKIFSTEPFLPWTKECLGVINENDKRHLYKSANVCLHFPSDNLSARPFEIMAAGGHCYSPRHEKLERVFGDRINYVETYKDIKECADKTKDNMKFILTKHTFLQRWNQIFERIG